LIAPGGTLWLLMNFGIICPPFLRSIHVVTQAMKNRGLLSLVEYNLEPRVLQAD
jgi:hypothetical protein